MKIFLINYSYMTGPEEASCEVAGIVQAKSEEDACMKLGIDPKQYFKEEVTANGFEMSNGDFISFTEADEASSWNQLIDLCRQHKLFHSELFTDSVICRHCEAINFRSRYCAQCGTLLPLSATIEALERREEALENSHLDHEKQKRDGFKFCVKCGKEL